MGIIWRLIFGVVLLGCIASCTRNKEKMQGQWHGEIYGAGGHLQYSVNLQASGDSVQYDILPDNLSLSITKASYHIDSFFLEVEFHFEGDTVSFWSANDDSCHNSCFFCGKLVRGYYTDYPKHYLQNHLYGPFQVPIVNREGWKATWKDIGFVYDSMPVFVGPRSATATIDSPWHIYPCLGCKGFDKPKDLPQWKDYLFNNTSSTSSITICGCINRNIM